MNNRRRAALRLAPLAAAVALAFPVPAQSAAINWTAGNGLWEVAGNWSGGVPGAGDSATVSVGGINTITYAASAGTRTVGSLTLDTGTNTFAMSGGALTVVGAYSNTSGTTISGGVLTLNGASTLASLTQSNGSIGGTGTVTISGVSNITFGDHRGSGTTQFNGDVNISSSGFRLDGGRTVNLGSGSNNPILTWTGGQILFNNTFDSQGRAIGNDTINIAAGATFIASGAGAGQITFSGASGADTDTGANSQLNNAGILRREGAVGTTTIDVRFSNTGTVDVQTGILSINGPTSTLSGNQSIAAGAVLRYSPAAAGTATLSAGSTTGAGTFEVTSGTVLMQAGHTNAGTVALSVTGGLFSSTGNRSFAALTQSSGSIGGTGTLTISGVSNITFGDHRGSGTTQFNGDVNISSSGFRLDGGRTVTLGTGTTLIWTSGQILFNNTADGQGRAIGNDTINIAAGATFIASGASAGQITFSGASGADTDTGANSLLNNAGTLRRAGAAGTTTIDTRFTSTGTVDVQTGVLAFASNSTFTGGSIGGAGRTSFGGVAGTVHSISNTTTFNPANVTVSNGAVNVAGNYNVGTETAVSGGVLNLNGTVTSLGSALTISGGLLNLNALTASTGTLTQSSGSIGGTGTLTISGVSNITFGDHRGSGTTQFNGDVNISSSGFRLDGGRTVTLGTGTTLIWTSGQILFNNTADGQGRAIGNDTINIAAGATFIASGASAGQITFSGASGADTDTGANSLLNNAGTLRRAGAAGTTTIDTRFTSTGTVDVQTGVLAFASNSTFTGGGIGGAGRTSFGGVAGTVHSISNTTTFNPANVTVSNGAVNVAGNYNVGTETAVSGGVLNLNGTVTSLGSALTISGGLLNLNALTASTGTLTQSSGSIGGTGTLTISGVSNITFGDHRGSGTTQFNGDVNISSSGFRLDGGRTVTLGTGTTLIWTSGQILFNNTADGQGRAIGNDTINIAAGATFIASGVSAGQISFSGASGADTDTGANSQLNNAGTLRRAGSAGTTTIDTRFSNTGTVDVQTGTLSIDGLTSTLSGNQSIASGAVLRFNGAAASTTTLSAGSTTGTGTFQVAGGTVSMQAGHTNADTVALTVSAGLFNAAGNRTFSALTQSNGSIGGTGTLSISGVSNITFGDHRGSGTTQFNGDVNISSSGFRLDGGRTVTLGNGTTLIWTSGQILFNNTADGQGRAIGNDTINIAAGATFIASGASAGQITFSGASGADTDTGANSQLNNAGTLRRAGSAGTTTIDTRFSNTGTVDVQTGTLSIDGLTSTLSGNQSIASGAVLRFNGAAASTTTLSAGSTTGTGTFQVAGGTVSMQAGHTNADTVALTVSAGLFNAAGNRTFSALTQSNGSIGGTGTLSISGVSNITFGDHRGSGTTQFNGDVNISSSGFRLDGGRTVTLGNGTTLIWTSGQILFNNTADGQGRAIGNDTINIAAGATFIASGASAGQITFSGASGADTDTGANSLLNNAGTLRRAGSAGTTTIDTRFSNTGTVDVQTGILSINGSTSTLTGNQSIAAGAMLRFSGGAGSTATLSAGSSTGNGTFEVASGTVNMQAGHTNSDTLALSVTSGLFNVAGNRSFAALTQSNGSIGGTGTLTINGVSNITFGDHRGSGTTQFNGDVNISSSGFRLDGGRTVNLGNGSNSPTLTWTGGQILFNNTADSQGRTIGNDTINIAAGATFIASGASASQITFSGASGLDTDTGANSRLNNAGTLRREGVFGSTSIDVVFNNTGTVQVQAGVLQFSGSVVNLAGGTLTGGVWQVQTSSTLDFSQNNTVISTNAADIYLVGAGSVFRTRDSGGSQVTLEQTLATNAAGGALRLQAGRTFNSTANSGNFTNAGILEVNGSTFTSTTLVNNGVIAGFGNSTVTTAAGNRITGNGSIASSFGTLTITRGVNMGAGSVMTANPGATINLASAVQASTIGTLNQNGNLALGAQNLNVTLDYDNANFGVGNTFAPRANVTGAQIIGVGAAQSITATGNAANLTGGGNAFTLAFGNVRGGTSSTLNYQIANTGSGASIRGAVQNGSPGLGSVTDARLSGAGLGTPLTGSNFGPIAAGANSGNQAVTLTAGSTGGLLSGQSLGLVSNFSNIANQTLAITGFTTVLAQGVAAPAGPINLGNFRVGFPLPAPTTLSVTNSTTGAGAEQLGIGGVVTTGNFVATNVLGSGFVAPGATQAGAVNITMPTGVVGTNSGDVTVQFVSNGQLIDPTFTNQNVNSQSVGLTAQGFLVAQPALPATVNVGNFRAVQGAGPQAFNITNTAVAPAGFQELLNTTAGGTTGGATLAGSITGLARGDSSSAMSVGFAAGGVAGVRNGTATVNLETDGTGTSGLGLLALTAGVVNVTGNAYALAQPALPTGPINLGNFRVGAAPGQTINITNTLVASGFQEGLDVSAGALTGTARIAGGPISNLAAGTSSSAITLGLNALTAGNNTGTATLNLASNGTGTSGLGTLALASSAPITINATGWNLAAASVTPSPIVLANQRVGGTLSQALTVANTAPAGAFTEGLNASFGTNAGNALNNGGSVNLLAGGASNNSALVARVDTTAAGARSGSVTVNLVSDGTASTLGNTNLTPSTINVSGNVYQVAQPTVPAGPINLGNVRVGGSIAQTISIGNTTAAPAGFQERLNATVGTLTGNATGFGSVDNLAAGGTSSGISLGLSNITAGNNSATAVINLETTGAGTSGLGTLGLASSAPISINATGWRLAQAGTIAPINFGNVLRNSTQERFVTISNTAVADGFSEGLNASVAAFGGGSAGLLSGAGTVSNLAAGASNNSTLRVILNTANTGSLAGDTTASFSLVSNGDASGLGNTNLGLQTVSVSGVITGTVGDLAVASSATPNPVNFGNFRVAAAAPGNQALTISNLGTGAGEGLNASIATASSGFSATGSFANLARVGGANTNSTNLVVGFSDTATAGAKNGNATITLASDGTFNGGVATPLGTQNVALTANVYQVAQPNLPSGPINLGNFRVGAAPGQTINIGNTLVAAGFQEGLDVSAGALTGTARIAGAPITNLAAGSNSSAITLGLTALAAGNNTGTAVLNLASNGTGTSGLATLDLASSAPITINATGWNLASAAAVSAVAIGNQRVGTLPGALTSTITIANSAPAAFSETLNASFTGSTGNAITNAGSVTQLVAGSSNTTAMRVGVDNTVAGARSGSFTVGLVSDGTPVGNSGLGTTPLTVQTVNVTGNVYQVAQPTLPANVNFGNFRVGSTPVAQAVTIGNTNIAPAGFQEGLNASIGALTGAAAASGSPIVNLAAGGTSNALSVGITGIAGSNAGTVGVTLASNGTISGLTNLALTSGSIAVSGQGFVAATGQLNSSPLNFGTVQVGQVVSQVLSITNSALGPNGFVEDLGATFGAASGTGASRISGTGSITGLLAGATNTTGMTVTVDTSSAGSVAGAIAVNYTTAGAVNGVSNGLGTASAGSSSFGVNGTINAVATVINQASPVVNNAPINLGSVRVGAVSPTALVSVTNQSVGAPQAALNASISGGGAITASGSFNLLAPGATNASSLQVGLNTATAGNFNGSTATLSLVSDANNVGGCAPNCQLNLANQTVTVNGKVYTEATAAVASAVNFGIVRVGDVVAARGVSVANSAAVTALNDTLAASIGGTSGVFSNNGGSVSGLTAGSPANTTALTVSMSTAAAGVFSGVTAGSATVTTRSQNPDMADVVGTTSVTLLGQVNNLAQAAFRQVSGAGAFSEQAGNTFTLDFGNVSQGAILTARLAAWNRAPGGAPSDSLKGTFSGAAGNGTLSFSGFNPFGPSTGNAGLDAQQSTADLLVNLLGTAPLGFFSQTVSLAGFSYNGFGLDLPTNALLVLSGTIVDGTVTTAIPLPPAGLLLLGGLGAMGWLGRRRRTAIA